MADSSDSKNLDILAIAAHPDDVEITCGGLLIKMSQIGRKVGVLDLTRGEMGTSGDEHDRDTEAKAAAKIMKLVYRHNLELPDSALERTQVNRLKVAQVIRDTKPEMVILPHWEQRHPDHIVASNLGYDGCWLAGLKKAKLQGEPHRPRKIIYVSYFRNREHSFLVDISDVFETKLQAVAAYQSQFKKMSNNSATYEIDENQKSGARSDNKILQPGVDIVDLMRTRARALGQLADCEYAEAYTIKESIRIDDPQKMPVPSI